MSFWAAQDKNTAELCCQSANCRHFGLDDFAGWHKICPAEMFDEPTDNVAGPSLTTYPQASVYFLGENNCEASASKYR